jgi:hypothetical protein
MADLTDNEFVDKMQAYLFIGAIGVTVTFLTLFFAGIFSLCVKSCKDKVLPAPKRWCGLFWFNGFILSFSLVFLPMCIYTAQGLQKVFLDQDSLILERRKDLSEIDWFEHNIMTSFVMMFIILLTPMVFYCILNKYKDRLTERGIKARIWNLYADLSMFDRQEKIAYYPAFLLKRLVFVMIPSLCYWGPFAQIQALIVLTTVYVIFYAGRKPHDDKRRIHLEICNEVCFMVMNYHMICFSNFNTDP